MVDIMQMVGEKFSLRTECVGPTEHDMKALIASFEPAIEKKPRATSAATTRSPTLWWR
ncbi:MAG: hypothetical protein WCL50_07820 [Spirochaetota bacterium]